MHTYKTHTPKKKKKNSLVKKLSWKLEPPHATNNKIAPLGSVPASPLSPLPSPHVCMLNT